MLKYVLSVLKYNSLQLILWTVLCVILSLMSYLPPNWFTYIFRYGALILFVTPITLFIYAIIVGYKQQKQIKKEFINHDN